MIAMKKTTIRKTQEVNQRWHIVDATNQVVGRLAVKLAMVLMGKHRPDYTPNIDMGDYIVVVNCEKVVLTGNKWTNKMYRWHSGYIGGLKEKTAEGMLTQHPDRILRQAVKRMLPKGKLGEHLIKKLKIYAGTEHPHASQQPDEEYLKKYSK